MFHGVSLSASTLMNVIKCHRPNEHICCRDRQWVKIKIKQRMRKTSFAFCSTVLLNLSERIVFMKMNKYAV